MPTIQVSLQGIGHVYTSYATCLARIARYITIEVIIRDPQGKGVIHRRGCAQDTCVFDLDSELKDKLSGNITDITLHAPWSRYFLGESVQWPVNRTDSFTRYNLREVEALNLLSHIHELLVIAARYFVIKCTLQGNLWTRDFHLQQGLDELQGTNRSRLRDPATFYGNIRRHLALFDETNPSALLLRESEDPEN